MDKFENALVWTAKTNVLKTLTWQRSCAHLRAFSTKHVSLSGGRGSILVWTENILSVSTGLLWTENISSIFKFIWISVDGASLASEIHLFVSNPPIR